MATSESHKAESHKAELQRASVQTAVRILRTDGVVMHATEGVWGLACDPASQIAIQKVLAIKQREVTQGLLLIAAAEAAFAPELQSLSTEAQAQISQTWPGHVTWLVPNHRYSNWITGSHDTVAVRVPDHPQAQLLCAEFGGPLVSTSANLSGQPAATTQASATAALGTQVDYVLPGVIAGAKGASEIRRLDGVRLR